MPSNNILNLTLSITSYKFSKYSSYYNFHVNNSVPIMSSADTVYLKYA